MFIPEAFIYLFLLAHFLCLCLCSFPIQSQVVTKIEQAKVNKVDKPFEDIKILSAEAF